MAKFENEVIAFDKTNEKNGVKIVVGLNGGGLGPFHC